MSLRKRIIDSDRYARVVTGIISGYLRFAYRTSSWQRLGFEAMDDAVKNGDTIIMVLWHERLIMAPYIFDVSLGKLCGLTSSARGGTMIGKFLNRFGIDYVPMASRQRHVALSRTVLNRMKDGSSIAIAADGSRGPAHKSTTVPVVWARVSGKRVFAVSFSSRRSIRIPTWDRTVVPRPFSSGVFMCQEWNQTVPRKGTEAEYEDLRLDLEGLLNEVTDASDLASGHKS
ncbi:DUF374 domain-containing protein [Pseudosulfitobacter sp. SM2401]|uniref:lysophospholipid acyltransferase family protein n=1 Tax=Pseudosulfitobacter sp. SM2401 TaxID=3350098 RepID=UPI0036F1E93A